MHANALPCRERIPVLPLGRILTTPAALEALVAAGINPMNLLARHESGDWGDLCPEDKEANNRAVSGRERVLSSYNIRAGVSVWIITEWDRSVTTLLLPSEY